VFTRRQWLRAGRLESRKEKAESQRLGNRVVWACKRHELSGIAFCRESWQITAMKLTAVFEPAKEGGYTCFVEEVPAAISQGETIEEAKANLLDALQLVLRCQRDLAEKGLSPHAVRQTIQLAEA
jgi:predicted RNase H-like HicB family nuclease